MLLGGWGERKREPHDGKWNARRDKRGPLLFPLPIVPRAFSIFRLLLFLLGYPARSLCRAESNEALIPYLYCRPFHCHDLFPRVERDRGEGAGSSTQALDLE